MNKIDEVKVMTVVGTYEAAKENIKVKLENVNAEQIGVYRSAKEYGFEDLNIVPYVVLSKIGDGVVSARITEDICRMWGVTATEVINQGIANLDYTIKGMNETLRERMRDDGMPEELIEIMVPEMDERIYVVSNRDLFNGASSIIAAQRELNRRFPQGYFVLPSSKHEVIVVPRQDGFNIDAFKEMVTDINGSQVDEKDRLSDNAYEILVA